MCRRKTKFERMFVVDNDEFSQDTNITPGFDLPDFQSTYPLPSEKKDDIAEFIEATRLEEDFLKSRREEDILQSELEARLKQLREGTVDSSEVVDRESCNCENKNKVSTSDVGLQTNLEGFVETKQRPILKAQRRSKGYESMSENNVENNLGKKKIKIGNHDVVTDSLNISMEEEPYIVNNSPQVIEDELPSLPDNSMETTSSKTLRPYNLYNQQKDQRFVIKQQRERGTPYKLYLNRYKCSMCQSKFKTLKELNVHLDSCNQIMYTCQLCYANFEKEQSLRRHVNSWHNDLNRGNKNKRKAVDNEKTKKFMKL